MSSCRPDPAAARPTAAPPAPRSITPHAAATVPVRPDTDARRARLLLDALIAHTGRSVDHVAREVLLRDRRTVQRWRAGHAPIPRPVREHIVRLLSSAASESNSR